MIRHQSDLVLVEYRTADFVEFVDGRWPGNIVGQGQVNLGNQQFSLFHLRAAGMPGQDFLCSCHTHSSDSSLSCTKKPLPAAKQIGANERGTTLCWDSFSLTHCGRQGLLVFPPCGSRVRGILKACRLAPTAGSLEVSTIPLPFITCVCLKWYGLHYDILNPLCQWFFVADLEIQSKIPALSYCGEITVLAFSSTYPHFFFSGSR